MVIHMSSLGLSTPTVSHSLSTGTVSIFMSNVFCCQKLFFDVRAERCIDLWVQQLVSRSHFNAVFTQQSSTSSLPLGHMAMVWGAVTVLCILSYGVGTDSLRKQLMTRIAFLPLLYQWAYSIRPIILLAHCIPDWVILIFTCLLQQHTQHLLTLS